METIRFPALIVVDEMELRRAGIMALVEPWARERGIAAVPISPSKLCLEFLSKFEIQFVIFNVGGASLHANDPMHWSSAIRDMLPGVPCVVLSDRGEAEEAVLAARLGHQAFMSTGIEPQIALQAFAFVIGGGSYFPREALLQTVSSGREGSGFTITIHGDQDRLTHRQHEVLDRLRLGKSNKVIARDLDMQESTVKVHVRQIMRKLGASNRTQAALLAAASTHTGPVPPPVPAEAMAPTLPT